MIGLIVGAVCAVGLVKVFRRYGYCARGGGGHGWRGFGGPRSWLRSIFERLGTTPGQEKAIAEALRDLSAHRVAVRDEMRQTRADIAQAVSSGLVDDATLEEIFARHDRLLAQVRVSFVEAVKKITEALDERQREQFVKILQGRGWFGQGPHWGDPLGTVWA